MALFGSGRDASLIRSVSNELLRYIDTEILHYKLVLDSTNENLYGESEKRTYYTPTRISTIVQKDEKTATADDFGLEFNRTGIFAFLRDTLKDANIHIEEGDIINLSIDASNSNDFPIVDFSLISNLFDVLSGPNQKTNIQYINGRLNSTKTLSWTLSPKNSGQVYIPPITGTIDGKNFKGKQILINVVKRKSIKSNSVFILADLDKNEAYIGEQVTLTYKLYKEMNVNIASIDQFQMPEFPGFWVEDLFNPQRLQYQKKIETINGMKYQVAILGQRALFPIPYKNYLIPPVQVKMQLEIQKKRRKRDPFFDPFFDSFFSESKTKLLISDKKKVTIKSYPKPKPKDFYGAVGDFKITSSVDLRKVKVNEGVTFKISLTGTGNLSLFSLPEIIFPEYVEVFKPNEVFEKHQTEILKAMESGSIRR